MVLSVCVMYKKGESLVEWRKSLPKENIEIIILETSVDTTLQETKIETVGTTEELKGFTIKFPSFEDHFDFSLCRNLMDKEATGDWILHMDSDERLSTPHEEFWMNVHALEQSGADVGYISISGITHERPTDKPYAPRYCIPAMRIHRKSKGLKWSGICHETLDIVEDTVSADTGIFLHHEGYALQGEDMKRKIERNGKLMIREYTREKSQRNWDYLIKTFSLLHNKQR